MKITITGRKVSLRDNFKELAKKKLSRFDRIFDEDADANVVVTLEKNRQTVEITIKQRGMIYRAESTALEMNDALDQVMSALGRQIRKNKTKLAEAFVDHELLGEEYDESEDEVVRTKTIDPDMMDLDEAIMRMEMLGHSFFIYRDDETREIAVVYKRNDGGYGLIETE